MAKKDLNATAKLFLDVSDAQSDAKKFIADLKKQLSGIETAADKMTVFKDMVGYIGQIDKALAALRAQNKDVFNHLFDGLDENFRKELESVFGATKEQLAQLDALKTKLSELRLKGNPTADDLKPIEQEIKDLYKSIGKLDEAKISGRGSIENRIARISQALENFAVVFGDVNDKIKGGFGFGGGGESQFSDEIQQQIDSLEKSIRKYEKLLEDIEKLEQAKKKIANADIPKQFGTAKTADEVVELLTAYKDLKATMDSLKASGDTSSLQYYETLIEYAKVATKLYSSSESTGLQSKLSKFAFKDRGLIESLGLNPSKFKNDALGAYDLTGVLQRMQSEIDAFFNGLSPQFGTQIAKVFSDAAVDMQNQLDKLKADATKGAARAGSSVGVSAGGQVEQNKKLALSYDELSKKVQRYNDLVGQLNGTQVGSDEWAKINDEMQEIVNSLQILDTKGNQAISDILGDMEYDGIPIADTVNAICTLFGIELPADIDVAQSKLQEFFNLAKTYGDMTYLSEKDANSGIKKLEEMRAELIELSEQGKITSADMNAINDVFDKTSNHLRTMDRVGGSGSGGDGPLNVDFSSLESTIKSEMSALSGKLDNVLKVELVKDDTKDIQGAIESIKATVDNISSAIDNYKAAQAVGEQQAEVNVMRANLQQLLQTVSEFNKRRVNGQYQQQELSAAILSDGSISVGYGEDGTVPWDRMASSLVANLTKSLMVDIYSHPWSQLFNGQKIANDSLSGSKGDLGAWRFSKELGAQLAAMITGNIMQVFDISKLTQSQMSSFRSELAKLEPEYAKKPEYSQYIGYDQKKGNRYIKSQTTISGYHKVSEIFTEMMYEALANIGISRDQVDKDIYKKYDLTNDAQLTLLAETLVQLSHASQNALSPVERLAQIIENFGGDVNTEKAKAAFAAFEKGELTAAGVFNGIMEMSGRKYKINQDTMDSLMKIDSAHEVSAVESLLTQITSVLDVISSNIANIANNTRLDASDRLGATFNDLFDMQQGIGGEDAFLKNVKSIFDPLNISKYKNDEVLSQSLSASDSFFNHLRDAQSLASIGKLDLGFMQELLDKFAVALSNTKDAMKQIDLYEKRTREEVIDQGTGEIASGMLDERYSTLTESSVFEQLLGLISGARESIALKKNEYVESDIDEDGAQIAGHLQSIQSTLDSIHGILSGFTGLDAQNKNSLTQKEPVVDNGLDRKEFSEQDLGVLNSILDGLRNIDNSLSAYLTKTGVGDDSDKPVKNDIAELANFIRSKLTQQLATEDTLASVRDIVNNLYTSLSQQEPKVDDDNQDVEEKPQSDVYQLLASRLPQNIATEETSLAIKSAIEQLANVLKANIDGKGDDNVPEENLSSLVASLSSAVKTLQDVANGIIQHQQAQKSDTSKAMARIADPKQHQLISDIATNSVGQLGTEVQIKSLKALANGLVKVDGAFKNAQGQWEGFTVKVNESNAAVDLAIDKQSAFAKALNQSKDQMDDDNAVAFSPEETYKKALEYMRKLHAEGKKATLQYQDSGRYTVSTEETVGGLSKKTFQTFDEFQRRMSRTTVTMSNALASSIRDTEKLISESSHKVANADLLKKYNDEYANLLAMNQKYEAMDNLGEDDIEAWNKQIELVQRLGGEVTSLIKQQTKLEGQSGVATSAKRLQEYQAKANQIFKELGFGLNDENKTPGQQKIVNIYDQIIEKVDMLRKSHAVLTDSQIQDINKLISSLKSEADAYTQATGGKKSQKQPKQTDPAKGQRQKLKQTVDDASKDLGRAFGELDFKIDTKDLSDEAQKIADEYKDLSDILRKYSRDASSVSQQDLNATMQRVAALQQEIKAYKDKYNIVNGRGGTKNAHGKTVTVNAQAKFNTLQGRAQSYIDVGSTVVDSGLKQYKEALEKLVALQSQFKSGQQLTSEQQSQFEKLKLDCNEYYKALKKVLDESDKLAANGMNPMNLMDDVKLDTSADRAKALRDYVQETYGASAAIGKLNGDATQLTFTLKNGDGTITNMTASLSAARNMIASTAGDTQKATTAFGRFFDEVKGKVRSIGTYLISMTGFQEVWQAVRQGIQYVRDIDLALTELKKVTNETNSTYDAFLQTMSKTAGTVGSTVANLTTMASEWARLGYSLEEAGQLAESTAILLNVSEFDDATAASEALISTMQAFGYAANESQHVVDILNEVGNNYAVSSDGIATALQDSASALMEGGNSLEQATALVAAANRVVQDPSSVGK